MCAWCCTALLLAGCSSAADADGEDSAFVPPTTATTSEAGPSDSQTTLPSAERASPAEVDDLEDLDGQIVLRDADGNLVVVASTGELFVQLASGESARHTQPTWSYGADRVAWSRLSPDDASIEMASIDGSSSSSTALSTPPFFFSWSPDDDWLGALRPVSNTIEFLVLETSTVEPRSVGVAQPFFFDWRSNSAVVAAINQLAVVEIPMDASVEPAPFALGSPLGLFQTPAVIDSENSVVALARPGWNDVVVLGPGQEETTIGRASGGVSLAMNAGRDRLAVLVASGAPESQVIAFQIDAPPELVAGRVSIIDLDTGAVTTEDSDRIVATQWSPDGQTLAMLQATGDELHWLIRHADGAVAPTTPFVPSTEFASSYVPFADQYNHASTWWSPDSLALVFSGAVDGQEGVWVDRIDDDGGAIRISTGDIALWSPR